MSHRSLIHRAGPTLVGVLPLLLGCGAVETKSPISWAINVGGPALVAVDGTRYVAGTAESGGTAGTIAAISGTQEPRLYQTYREGEFDLSPTLANGRYDLTFHFAEPHDLAAGERVFDVYAEGERVIADLDVVAYRDGNPRAALTVTVPDVVVADGRLDVEFRASKGVPLLNALVARPPIDVDPSWQLVWSDEFDTDGPPDADNWNIEEWPPRKVNDEDQAYTARTKNLRVENGRLIIEAHREQYGEAEYTSGRIQSQGKRDFLYGRFEARARLPAGQGTWPAIWMLGSDPFIYATNCSSQEEWHGNSECDAWPNSGEIDIMEHVGYQMNHVHGTVHTRAYYWVNGQQRKGRVILDDVADAFHVYALEWSPERIDIFVDDTLYFTYMNDRTGWQSWPFDHPFHLILNQAIGGGWGRAGGPIDNSIFPQRMEVDWVRVYQRAE